MLVFVEYSLLNSMDPANSWLPPLFLNFLISYQSFLDWTRPSISVESLGWDMAEMPCWLDFLHPSSLLHILDGRENFTEAVYKYPVDRMVIYNQFLQLFDHQLPTRWFISWTT